MNDEKDLLLLFDQIVEDGYVKEELSKEQIEEIKRLDNLYNLSQDNTDEVFDKLTIDEEICSIHIRKKYLDGSCIGKQYNSWTVIEYCDYKIKKNKKSYDVRVIAECKCGKRYQRYLLPILAYKTKSCHSCSGKKNAEQLRSMSLNKEPINKKYYPKIGDRFGLRTITNLTKDNNWKLIAEVKCSCGHIGNVYYPNLVAGKSHSCKSCRNKLKDKS